MVAIYDLDVQKRQETKQRWTRKMISLAKRKPCAYVVTITCIRYISRSKLARSRFADAALELLGLGLV
jgi:hypothetical protein